MYDIGGQLTRRCPLASLRLPYVQAALTLYAHWKQGHSPHGQLSKETAHYVAAMPLIASLQSEAEGWYTAELQRRSKHGTDTGRRSR